MVRYILFPLVANLHQGQVSPDPRPPCSSSPSLLPSEGLSPSLESGRGCCLQTLHRKDYSDRKAM